MEEDPRLEAALREVVRRRQAQRLGTTASIGTSTPRTRGGKNKAAIIWEGEPGDTRTITYGELHREVSKFANVLKGLGVARRAIGSRLYMPMIPELAIAMLACTRIGAPHSIVFGGFSADALRDRINDAGREASSSRPTAAIAAVSRSR